MTHNLYKGTFPDGSVKWYWSLCQVGHDKCKIEVVQIGKRKSDIVDFLNQIGAK